MKAKRQREILRQIAARQLRTQDELSGALESAGIAVSQGTLSRDLRELGVVKTADGYVPGNRGNAPRQAGERLAAVLPQIVRGLGMAQHLVVLRTQPGGANMVAQLLDASEWPEVIGTVAGDDTIFVATADMLSARRVQERLETL